MKGLSLFQPWASLVAIGAKTIETRAWNTLYRGPIAIHASKKSPKTACEFADDPRVVATGLRMHRLPFGAIIAVAYLVETKAVEAIRANLSAEERAFGNYEDGRTAWLLKGVKPVVPEIAYRGAMNLWSIDEETQKRLTAFLG